MKSALTSASKLAFHNPTTFISIKSKQLSRSLYTMSLNQRTAVVTGGTKGIGRGIAIGLAEKGAHVIVTGRTKTGPGSLQELSQIIQQSGGSCSTYVVDHSSDESIHQWFDTMKSQLDQQNRTLDIFVNNAYSAVSFLTDSAEIPFWKKSATNPSQPDTNSNPGEVWDVVNGVGLRNHWICSTYAMRMMEQSKKGGFIINITSWGGIISLFDSVYGIGKSAVERMSSEIAKEAPEGIYSFALCPGFVSTEALTIVAEQQKQEEQQGQAPVEKLANDPQLPMWNAETPIFVGRVLAAIVTDGNEKLFKSVQGKVVIAAEIADRLKVQDEKDFRALSFRSVRFECMNAIPFLRESFLRHLIPRGLLVPWPLVRAVTGAVRMWN